MTKYKSYKGLKVLITGSTGFKGSWLCLWLYLLGAKVYGLSLKNKKENVLFSSLNLQKKIKQYDCDINNYKKTNDLIKKIKPDIIFHLAAQALVTDSYLDPLKTFETNVFGGAVIMKSFIENKINSMVFCTSDKCYKNKEQISGYIESDEIGGSDPYSASKACAEILFNSFVKSYDLNLKNTNCASVRSGNVIGGGDFGKERLIPDIIKNFYNGTTVKIKNPLSIRPWQFVLEPLDGYLKLGLILMNKQKRFHLPSWNFGPDSKQFYTVDQLIKYTKQNFLKNLKIKYKKNIKIYETKTLFVNNEKAKKELAWKPRLQFNSMLDNTFDWYSNYYSSNDMLKFSITQIEKYSQLK